MCALQYDKDLWRCGDPEFYYGYRGEISNKFHPEDNTKIYYRYPYPGGPFRDIKGDSKGMPVTFKDMLTSHGQPVCTPSIVGSASALSISRIILCFAIAANSLFLMAGFERLL
jgi:hypothetical protein